jgi:drug/metabolite transporter (DMT)-like permease
MRVSERRFLRREPRRRIVPPFGRSDMTFRFAAPFLFVLIWSTGFIAARLAAPHADLNLFLLVQFVGFAIALVGVTVIRRG